MERKAYPEFYRQIFKLLIPIVIQNMLNAAVSSADVPTLTSRLLLREPKWAVLILTPRRAVSSVK